MYAKFKAWFKASRFYTIYLFFVRNWRNTKISVKKTWRSLTANYYKFYTMKVLYPHIYKKHAKDPVNENKICFVNLRYDTLKNSFDVVYDTLMQNYDFDLNVHFLLYQQTTRKDHRKRVKAMLMDIATAKVIFRDEGTNIFSHINIREETKVVQLWHGCGAFKKFGLSTANTLFGNSLRIQQKYPLHKDYDLVTVSSPDVCPAYNEAFGLKKEQNIVCATGVSRTDIFFDNEFKQNAFDALYELVPEAKNKKVILYAPTFRGTTGKAKAPDRMNFELMNVCLSDEYVMIVKQHPLVKNPPDVEAVNSGFCFEMTHSGLSIEQLLCVSDILISDYSSVVFEYSLFLKPMIFLSYDIDTFCDWRGFYFDYDQMTPGPKFDNTIKIVDYIKNIDKNFDQNRIKRFRDKFMRSCDGHSTDRILDMVLGQSTLLSHKRAEPLKKAPYHTEPCADDFYSFGISDEEIELEVLEFENNENSHDAKDSEIVDLKTPKNYDDVDSDDGDD